MKILVRVGVVALVGVTSALGGAVGSSANGSTAAPRRVATTATVVSGGAAVTAAEQRRITRYWTAARMRAARPAEALLAGRSRPGTARLAAAGAPRAVSPTIRPMAGGFGWSGGGAVIRTTGKVFFTLGGRNYVCSGSAVTSGNKDAVLTAGHCVHEGPGSFATNWAFVPGYDDGSRPYGTFTARRLYTTTAWQRRGDFNYDVGFALVNPVGGRDLVDTVGGQGIAFNQPRGTYMYAFGYPAAAPYTGQKLIHCHGTVVNDTYGRTNDLGMGCDMTGGSSGGPWFYGFDTSSGTGTLNSVNSFGYTAVPNVMWGPYFGNTISSLYSTAQNG